MKRIAPGLSLCLMVAVLAVFPAAPATESLSGTSNMYAYYYLWWDTAHWTSHLGSAYGAATDGFKKDPLPLPAALDTAGCNPRTLYPGDELTDVSRRLWTQASPSQIAYDVHQAYRAGLRGFAVDWVGTGTASQTPSSSSYDSRLNTLIQVVDQFQRAGHSFHLWVSYQASAHVLTRSHIRGDLAYLHSRYGKNSAWDRANAKNKITLLWVGSYRYLTSTIATVVSQFAPDYYFVGGYSWNSWRASDARFFRADSPYWSSQDPYTNRASFGQLRHLASALRSEGRKYFAPAAPGYDNQLLASAHGRSSGTCVPRDNGKTLLSILRGNSSGKPNGWLVISWNEITEGTYVSPELERYGSRYVNLIRKVTGGP